MKGNIAWHGYGYGMGMVRDGGEEVLAIEDESSERLAEAGSQRIHMPCPAVLRLISVNDREITEAF